MERNPSRPATSRRLGSSDDPFGAVRREMDRLLDDVTRSLGLTRPLRGEGAGQVRVDVRETDQAIEVQAELPGVDEKDVELQLADNVLTIKGEKRQAKHEEEHSFHAMERSYGSFVRRIPLPVEVDEDKVEATFAKGVLTVILPKSPAAKAKRIEIKTG